MSKASQKSPKVSLTPAMREMLSQIARGADPNVMAQVARIMGRREENQCARTLLGLKARGLLQFRQGGGLEISPLGTEVAERRLGVAAPGSAAQGGEPG